MARDRMALRAERGLVMPNGRLMADKPPPLVILGPRSLFVDTGTPSLCNPSSVDCLSTSGWSRLRTPLLHAVYMLGSNRRPVLVALSSSAFSCASFMIPSPPVHAAAAAAEAQHRNGIVTPHY